MTNVRPPILGVKLGRDKGGRVKGEGWYVKRK